MTSVQYASSPDPEGDRQGKVDRHDVWMVAAAFVSVMLAVAGQLVTRSRQHVWVGILAFLLALAIFFAVPLNGGRQSLVPDRSGTRERYQPLIGPLLWRTLLFVASAVLATAAYQGFAGNRLDGGIWYWLAALAYFFVAFVKRPARGWKWLLREKLRSISWPVIATLIATLLIAIFFRAYRLDGVPAEMTSDHAEKLLDVYDVLNGRRPIFFPRNTGREGFQFYLTAALVRLTPLTISHLALKVGTAIFGVVAVPFTYLLGRELYGRTAGLLAAFLLSVSHWHVAITRVGLRFPFTAAFAVPALYFLVRALRQNRRNDWLWAGLVLGLGLHTYTAMRIVPLLFALLVLIKAGLDTVGHLWTRDEGHKLRESSALQWTFWENAFLGALTSLVAFLPLLRYMRDRPEMFWYRAWSRAQGVMALPALWRAFWGNVKNALLMFNYRGDLVPTNTIPESAELGLVSGGLFVLGCGYLLWRVLRYREREAIYTMTAFFVLLLPSILSLAYPRENPSVVRAGGAVPIVMIMASLPLAIVIRRLRGMETLTMRRLAALGLALLLIVATVDNYRWYFVGYDENVRRSLWNATEMGSAVQAFVQNGGRLENAYHVPYPHWVDTRNIAINAGDITWRKSVSDLSAVSIHKLNPARKLYILHPRDARALKILRANYPQGVTREYRSRRPGKDFLLFYVPPREP